jgi:hypothetical protein
VTRKYSSISIQTSLASGINNTQTTLTVTTDTGTTLLGGITLASGNVDQFTLAIDPDTSNEEIVFATAISADTFTIVRGRAASSAIAHSSGAVVRHVLTSNDLTYFNAQLPENLAAAKGDILVASGAGAVQQLSVGSNNSVLVADSTQTLGVKWGTVSATPRIGQVVTTTITTSTSFAGAGGFVDIPGLEVTITPTSATSKILIITSFGIVTASGPSSIYANVYWQMTRGSTAIQNLLVGPYYPSGGNVNTAMYTPFSNQFIDSPATTSPTLYKVQLNNISSIQSVASNPTGQSIQITAMEILV